ncbi:MAG: TonB-dependent receptor [Kiritimatiellae bacterium]|jgi:hemoglobin/transferrin/lactoferrin receptor protein|nr:TonB-dependent receptor [Kiritimatiellia bacterium]
MHRIIRPLFLARFVPAGLIYFLTPVTAQEQTQTLPAMEVTGTRLTEAPERQPYAFYRTDPSELNARVGRTALDRLNYGPGLFLQRTAPNQASPFIRGLTGEQALLLLDGVRLNHAMMRPGPNQYSALVPEVSIDAMDVILGASSAVNGSDGLTGALDIRLADPGRGVTQEASPWLAGRVDTGTGGTLQSGVDGLRANWAYSLEVSGSMFHDQDGGDSFRDRLFGSGREGVDSIPNTAYDEAAGGLRLAYFGWENHLIEIKSGHTRQLDAPRPDGYFENTGKKDRISRYFDPQVFSYVHLRDTWELGAPSIERLQTTLWWHRVGEEQFREDLTGGGNVYRRREYEDTLDALGLDLQATTLWQAGGDHELTWGGTFLFETTDNRYREFRTGSGVLDPSAATAFNPNNWSNNTTLSDGSEYTTLGLFAQDQWRITERVSLLSSARYSRVDWSFGEVEGDTDDLSGGLRGLVDLTDTQNVFVGLSRGFRAPNLVNLDGLSDRGSSGEFAKGNPDLKPEISHTLEGGWRWIQDRDQLQVSIFHTTIDDLIQRDFSADSEFTNVEDAELKGAEAAWDLGLNSLIGNPDGYRLALVGSVSVVDATRDIPEPNGVVTDNLSRANRLYGRVGLKYERDLNWWGLAQVRWHEAYDDVSTHPSSSDADDIRLTVAGNPDGSLPGYAVVDLMVGWRSDSRNRELAVYLENLADKTYREPGSGVDGVGLSLGVSGKVRF